MEIRQSNGWNNLRKGLREFYARHDKLDKFDSDCDYLRKAYIHIEELWHKNFDSVAIVNLVILGEAPLYGSKRSYFYNTESNHTPFFRPSDVQGLVSDEKIETSKASLIRTMNDLGIIILDVFPFALYENTAFEYPELTKKPERYSEFARIGKPDLWKKLDLIQKKQSPNIRFVLRYDRLRSAVNVVMREYLVEKGFISRQDEIEVISKPGWGNIDQNKFHQAYRAATQEAAV